MRAIVNPMVMVSTGEKLDDDNAVMFQNTEVIHSIKLHKNVYVWCGLWIYFKLQSKLQTF